MDAKTEKELKARMLEKAREFLEVVQDFIPEGGHAWMAVWPDHLSVDLCGPDPDGRLKTMLTAYTDPRKMPMEVSR